MNETRFFGLAKPMAATAHPYAPFYKEEYANAYIEYDPDRSNELLDEMGLTERDSDGYRLLPDGSRFTLTLEYPPDTHSWMPPIAELTKEYLRDIGIEMLEKTDDRSLYGQRVANNEVEFNEWATVGFTNTMITDPRCFVPYRTGDETIWYQLWSEWYVSEGERGEEPIPEVKDLINWYEEMITIADEDERNAVIDKILKSHAENLWTIGTLGMIPKPVLVDKNLGNVPKDGVHGYDTIRMQPNHPEQFFFKNQ
jgi:peptide/nickel transport system substrate-binding protein